MSKNKVFMATVIQKRNFRFYPIPQSKKGRSRKAKAKRLISVDDAIITTWMILAGLGYNKSENPDLVQTVENVFSTAPEAEEGE